MNTYTDPMEALQAADFMATRRQQRVYLLDAGNGQIRVALSFTEKDTILEIVQQSRESLVTRACYLRKDIQRFFDDVNRWNAVRAKHERIEADLTGELTRQIQFLDMLIKEFPE